MNEKYINKYLIKPADDGSREDTKLAVEYSDEQIQEFRNQGYVVVEDADFQKLIGNDEGKEYLIAKDGTLSEKPPYVPTPEEVQEQIKAQLTTAVQNHLDTTAQTRGYDNIHTACTYANSTDETFAAEGKACVAWRDTVWRMCYDILAEVLAGDREIPTEEELIAELPELVW